MNSFYIFLYDFNKCVKRNRSVCYAIVDISGVRGKVKITNSYALGTLELHYSPSSGGGGG